MLLAERCLSAVVGSLTFARAFTHTETEIFRLIQSKEGARPHRLFVGEPLPLRTHLDLGRNAIRAGLYDNVDPPTRLDPVECQPGDHGTSN